MPDRLLDTNAISAAMAGDATFLLYLERVGAEGLLLTSVIVEGEIRFGLSRLPAGRKKRGLSSAFAQVRASLHDILPVTPRTAARYAEVKSSIWARGRAIGENDLWISATALEHRLILVTNDRKLPAIDELLIDYWAAPR